MNKKLCTLAVIAVAASALFAPMPAARAGAEEKNVDVYIIAGQSNAVGYSNIDQMVKGQSDVSYTYRKQLTEADGRNVSGYESVLYYGAIEVRANAQFPGISLTNVHMGQGNGGNFIGPELGMASVLSERYTPQAPAAILKSAVGGTYLGDWEGRAGNTQNFGGWASPSLLQEWKNAGRTVHPYAGKLYDRLLETVTNGLEALKREGYEPHIKSYIWMQGESDTERKDWADSYAHNLELFINDARKAVAEIAQEEDAANRPFVIGKIAYDFANRGQPYIDTVRAAEDAVAASVPGVFTVNTDALHIGASNGSDLYHFNAGDMYQLGKLFAQTALDHLAKYAYAVTAEEGGTASDAMLFSDGESVSLSYTLERGKLLDKVLLNGEDVTSSVLKEGRIVFTPAEDTLSYNTVQLTFKDAKKLKLSVQLGEGGKISSRSLSGSTVYEGEVLTLTLAPEEGYEADRVLCNGVEVLPEGRKYVIEIGAEDCNVTVSFRKTASSEQPPEEEPSAEGCNGTAAAGAVGLMALLGGALFLKRKH